MLKTSEQAHHRRATASAIEDRILLKQFTDALVGLSFIVENGLTLPPDFTITL
jgi:hypothetical protein